MPTTTKYKHKPYTPAWEAAANATARSFAPSIFACADCGAPTVDGYCCTHCGSGDPKRGEDHDNYL